MLRSAHDLWTKDDSSSSPEHLYNLARTVDSKTVDTCGFPAVLFATLIRDYFRKGSTVGDDVSDDRLADIGEHQVAHLPTTGSGLAKSDDKIGQRSFECGENAVVLLCGGMATRFGGAVKALAEVLPGVRFIDVAISAITAIGTAIGTSVPLLLVTGVTTHRAIADYVADHWPGSEAEGLVRLVRQRVFPRINRVNSEILSGGIPVFYPPGHGDCLTSIVEQGAHRWLAARGVRRVLFWGIDNLLAGPASRIVGAHLRSGHKLTVEVVVREESERGGYILRRNGQAEIIEDFRLGQLQVKRPLLLNTNSMVIDLDILANLPDLLFYPVEKTIEGQQVLQFERLLGEITHWVNANFLLVPRTGEDSRFAPIKTPEDLKKHSAVIQRFVYSSQNVTKKS